LAVQLSRPLAFLLLVTVYYAVGKGGLLLATAHPAASPIWPASGLAVFALTQFGVRLWPAIFSGAFLINVTSTGSAFAALAIATGNTLEVLIACWGLRQAGLAPHHLFASPEAVIKYTVVAGLLSTSVSATIGTTSLALLTPTNWDQYGAIWLTWWLGDMGGILIVVPLLHLWYQNRNIDWTPRDLFERLVTLCILVTLSAAVYGGGLALSRGNYPLQVLVVPPLMWTAVRFGQRETASALLILTIVASYGTASGYGPFALLPPVESMLLLQAFLVVLTATTLTLGAVIRQQREGQTALAKSEHNVRRLLQEAEEREHQLREKQQQLVQAAKLASIGELTTGIAHELNNPLNNIALYMGNALDFLNDQKPPALIAEHLHAGMQQVRRGAAIINNLRTFGRAASLENEALSINSVVNSSVQLIQEQLRLSNIEVALSLCHSNPVVEGNRIQLEQVFLNLLSNAKDSVAGMSNPNIQVATWVEGATTHVAIEDNGKGIPSDVLPKIFDPFFTTKAVGQGTGLGLSIVYGIVREHRGTILAENREEGGARFLVLLQNL
jgi:signal transduction histidine kinase